MNIDLTKIDNVTLTILKGKFANTIAKIEGVCSEAKGDIESRTSYGAKAVFGRADNIRDSFYNDLRTLAIEIDNSKAYHYLLLKKKNKWKKMF